MYELCGGDYDSRKNPLGYYYHYAGLEVRNLITGHNKDKKKQRAAGMLVYREELDNQPHIKGYNGPMYNGIDEKSSVCSQSFSCTWYKDIVARRRYRNLRRRNEEMKEINIRVFDAGEDAVYQNLETGEVQLVRNNSVIASALPDRRCNYNRIVRKIRSYLSSYIKGSRETIVEENVDIPGEV